MVIVKTAVEHMQVFETWTKEEHYVIQYEETLCYEDLRSRHVSTVNTEL